MDDFGPRGVSEPPRMFTSRASIASCARTARILRLTEIGRSPGCVDDARWVLPQARCGSPRLQLPGSRPRASMRRRKRAGPVLEREAMLADLLRRPGSRTRARMTLPGVGCRPPMPRSQSGRNRDQVRRLHQRQRMKSRGLRRRRALSRPASTIAQARSFHRSATEVQSISA